MVAFVPQAPGAGVRPLALRANARAGAQRASRGQARSAVAFVPQAPGAGVRPLGFARERSRGRSTRQSRAGPLRGCFCPSGARRGRPPAWLCARTLARALNAPVAGRPAPRLLLSLRRRARASARLALRANARAGAQRASRGQARSAVAFVPQAPGAGVRPLGTE